MITPLVIVKLALTFALMSGIGWSFMERADQEGDFQLLAWGRGLFNAGLIGVVFTTFIFIVVI